MNLTYDENQDRVFDNIKNKIGGIRGQIMDKNNKPVVGVNVVLNINSSIYPNNKILTNTNGNFSFSDIPIGLYSITISGPEFEINNQINISVENNTITDLKIIKLSYLEKPISVVEDIANNYTYFCISVLVFMSLITFIGAISALQRKRYGLVFMSALIGMIPVIIVLTIYTCGAGIVSLIGLILLVFSREEFFFKAVR